MNANRIPPCTDPLAAGRQPRSTRPRLDLYLVFAQATFPNRPPTTRFSLSTPRLAEEAERKPRSKPIIGWFRTSTARSRPLIGSIWARVIAVVILFRLKGKPRIFPFTGSQYLHAEVTSRSYAGKLQLPRMLRVRSHLGPPMFIRCMLGDVVFLGLSAWPSTSTE